MEREEDGESLGGLVWFGGGVEMMEQIGHAFTLLFCGKLCNNMKERERENCWMERMGRVGKIFLWSGGGSKWFCCFWKEKCADVWREEHLEQREKWRKRERERVGEKWSE